MLHLATTIAQSDIEKLKKIREGEWSMMLWIGLAIVVLGVIWLVLRTRASRR